MRQFKVKNLFSWRSLLLSACAAFAVACVPSHMQVRDGITPENVDKQVRFRTTYYFRVFDHCADSLGATTGQPETDSLYRFVMTGKAAPGFQKIQFESGTLKASQIDPFGTSIEYDRNVNAFRVVTPAEQNARSHRAEVLEIIDTLVELDKKLRAAEMQGSTKVQKEGAGSSNSTYESARGEIASKMESLVSMLASRPDSDKNNKEAGLDDAAQKLNCPPGFEVQRGFQVMGPQGIRTFDQEDRLIMAMSTSSQPLLSALEEVSGRITRAEKEKLSHADMVLPLLREQLRVSEIQRLLLKKDQTELDDFHKELTAQMESGDE